MSKKHNNINWLDSINDMDESYDSCDSFDSFDSFDSSNSCETKSKKYKKSNKKLDKFSDQSKISSNVSNHIVILTFNTFKSQYDAEIKDEYNFPIQLNDDVDNTSNSNNSNNSNNSRNQNNLCYFCNCKMATAKTTFILESKTKYTTCPLCNCILNFKPSCIKKCFLVKSNLSQKKINKIVLNYFEKHNNIPHPSVIDKNVKLIKLSINNFINAYVLMTEKEKSHFNDFKMMFTNDVISDFKIKDTINFSSYFSSNSTNSTNLTNSTNVSEPTYNSTSKNKKNDKLYDNSHFENIKLENYELSTIQNNMLEKYTLTNKKKQLELIFLIKNNLKNKCEKSICGSNLLTTDFEQINKINRTK